ncbi:MAG: hypothetical protein LBQ15_03565 [Clostridium sp.]|jgi:RNA-binding protein YlmH|nr:hypothetical protein [Clostridium sp.]
MALDSEKDLRQWRNRFRELADKSFRRGVYTFTGFLGLGEQEVFRRMEAQLRHVPYRFWGGMEDTERKILRFGSAEDLGYEEPYPISCIHMRPLSAKFSDTLSHRDFLGALMNLGMERAAIGDIQAEEKQAYLFCLTSMAAYICENLNRVRQTAIRCDVTQETPRIAREQPRTEEILVSSLREDVLIAKVYHESRAEVLKHFAAGKVYRNGRLCEDPSQPLKRGDVVNVRGLGKFIVQEQLYETKKGKLCVKTAVYP